MQCDIYPVMMLPLIRHECNANSIEMLYIESALDYQKSLSRENKDNGHLSFIV